MPASATRILLSSGSGGAGWVKVLEGFTLVASAASKQMKNTSNDHVQKITRHGFDMVNLVQRVAGSASYNNEQHMSNAANNVDVDVPGSGPSTEQQKIQKQAHDNSNDNLFKDQQRVTKIQRKEEHISSTHTKDIIGERTPKQTYETPTIEEELDRNVTVQQVKEEASVPSTRISRALGFATLGLKLVGGTAAEFTSRLFNGNTNSSSMLLSDKNSDTLTESLCRMRGAALKIGQMLSIQDESVLPPSLTRSLEQVRKGAYAMPTAQLQSQLTKEFNNNENWRQDLFQNFSDIPMAAASIGQVHKATLKKPDGREVVVKVQYPGVANSIESDLQNMAMLVKLAGGIPGAKSSAFPKGLFIDNILKVSKEELKEECDYTKEMQNQIRFRSLIQSSDEELSKTFAVPNVIPELCTSQILTSEYCPGGTIDKVSNMSQDERNRIARAIMRLTFFEIFEWRFMQTDPNWGNFLYDVGSGKIFLIDFGAAREYSKEFVEMYIQMIWASANQNREDLLDISQRLGFLTGDENEEMVDAHVK